MLNDILTVKNSTANAHKGIGWADFTSEVIKLINDNCSGVIFMLWGKPS